MPSIEEYTAVGLYDADSPGASGRLELLEWLAGQGFSVDDMAFAEQTLSLGAMVGDAKLLGGERLTREAAIERFGRSPEAFDRLVTAFGYSPLDPIAGLVPGEEFAADEVDTLAAIAQVASVFSVNEALGFVRVLGGSFARIADAAVSLFLNDIESPMLTEGRSELELAQSVTDAIGLLDGLGAQLDPILRRQVMQAVQRSRRSMIDPTERFNYRYAVGFVDLVGFTEVSGHFDVRELANFIRDFEGRAHDVVTEQGARVVKLIGDEVMFVATDASAACRSASALMEGFGAEHERVLPRGGVAVGDVLVRGGDYYGSVVNLASRLVDEAVPQEVLVTADVAADATECSFEPAGRRMVKGFDEPVVVSSLVG